MTQKRLPEVCKIQYGFPFDSAMFTTSDGMPLVRIRDVVRGYSETYTSEQCSESYIVDNGDLLIGMDGDFNIAKWNGGKALLNQRVCRLIPNDKIDKDYLFFFMPSALKKLEEQTPFVTVKHLSAKQLNSITIPVPELDEQKHISKALGKASALIQLYQGQLAKLDELIKARFIEMFGDCKANPKGWQTRHLKDISDVGSSKRVFVEDLLNQGIPFYRGTEIGAFAERKSITPELFISLEHYKELCKATGAPQIGDLLMPSICPDGRIWIVDTNAPFYFKDGRVLWVHHIDKHFNPVFLLYTLKDRITTDYSSIASGTTFAELKIFSLKNCEVFDAPITLQNQFAAFVAQAEKTKDAVQHSLDKAQLLFDSLMQKYFG